MSLTVESDYNSTTHQNPIIANLTLKRYGQDWPVEFNATRIESENTSDIIVSGSGAHWTLEFNSTVDRGRLNIEILEAAGIDQSGRISKPHSIQIGYGRPIVALNHLSAWWTFDEGNGTEVHDYFGKYVGTFDGVNGASVSFDASRSMFGSSLYFPQDAWVTTNAYAVDLGIDGKAERTISFWMYTENQIVDQPEFMESGEDIGRTDRTMGYGQFVDFGILIIIEGFTLRIGVTTRRYSCPKELKINGSMLPISTIPIVMLSSMSMACFLF